MLSVLCKRDWCVVEIYPVWPIWSKDLAPSTLRTCHLPLSLSACCTAESATLVAEVLFPLLELDRATLAA
jgi:hypothetical protein